MVEVTDSFGHERAEALQHTPETIESSGTLVHYDVSARNLAKSRE